jgi:hypothetical protein
MTLDNFVASDTIVAFVIPLVALLTSSPLMWREEHLWNFFVGLLETTFQSFSVQDRFPLSTVIVSFFSDNSKKHNIRPCVNRNNKY